MIDLIDKVLYIVLQNVTWEIMFSALFAQRRERRRFLPVLVRVIMLTCLRIFCAATVGSPIMPLLLIIGFYTVARIEFVAKGKALAVEVVFTYVTMELLCIICGVLSVVVCFYILGTTSKIVITIISGLILAVVLCIGYFICRKKDMSALGHKYSTGIFAAVLVMFLGAFGVIRTPYVSANKVFYIFVLFITITCFALLVVWAYREHKILREQERRDRELEALARERDDLRSENHRLGKVLPSLEHQYGELAEWARLLREKEVLTEFSEELQTKRHTVSQIRGALRERGGEGHSMEPLTVQTGIDALDGVLSQAAQRASLAGIRFDCRVWTKADVLLCAPGVTVLSIQQILSNLLDNALHTVELAGLEGRVVTCYMGQAEGGYQIEVLDSGAYFVPRILENLGRRGNTTDGNGIGLVHILEALAACNASLFISEFRTPHLGGAVKSVAVRFDGKAMAHLSVRAAEIDDADISIHSLLGREGCI